MPWLKSTCRACLQGKERFFLALGVLRRLRQMTRHAPSHHSRPPRRRLGAREAWQRFRAEMLSVGTHKSIPLGISCFISFGHGSQRPQRSRSSSTKWKWYETEADRRSKKCGARISQDCRLTSRNVQNLMLYSPLKLNRNRELHGIWKIKQKYD
jgi:hypothetical protein